MTAIRALSLRLDAVVCAIASETRAWDEHEECSALAERRPLWLRGCRIKPSEKRRGALAEVHSRADVRDDLAMDRPLATDKMGDFGAHA
jgi:hypothetical protein